MHRHLTWSAGALALMSAAPAAAQDPTYSVVPAAERLTLPGVFADADIVMQLIMGGLLLAGAAALGIWLLNAARRRPGPQLAGGMTFLSALAASGPLIGVFGSAYTLLNSFIAVANVRPTPSLAVLAPGFAEALLSAMLGLLVGAVAAIAQRHLKARIHGLGSSEAAPAGQTAATS